MAGQSDTDAAQATNRVWRDPGGAGLLSMKFSWELEIKAPARATALRLWLIFIVLLLACVTDGPNRAFASAPLAMPAGVPSLDDLAGDWKTRDELAQYPSIHNF